MNKLALARKQLHHAQIDLREARLSLGKLESMTSKTFIGALSEAFMKRMIKDREAAVCCALDKVWEAQAHD